MSGTENMLERRKGFTLIELLVVIVILGILAAIAIPKFANTKEKAYVGAMKSDLRNLASAEEGYFADHLSYTTDKSALEFNESQEVTISIDAGNTTGWRASAAHGNSVTICELYYGDAAGATATIEGLIECS